MPIRLMLALLAAFLCLAPTAARADTCAISDIPTLRACFDRAAAHDRFVLTADIACTREADCCDPGRIALMALNGAQGRVIDGQNHRIRRGAGQKSCAVLSIRNTQGLAIRNLVLDEDQATAPCELADKPCASTIDVAASRDIELDRVTIAWGKGYVVKLWNVQGATIRHSSITDAGQIGLFVGHYRFGASSRITLDDITIARARANGAAVQGADDVVITASRFIGNHWHGLWTNPNYPGSISPGGQLLLAQGSRIRITANRFEGGDCRDCKPSHYVAAIEVGEDDKAPGVHDLTIAGNLLCHQGPGPAIAQNPGTRETNVAITDNRLHGFSAPDTFKVPVQRGRNTAGLAACS